MRVLMTGATGFIGSRIAASLLRDHASITALKRPDSDISYLNSFLPNICFINAEIDQLKHIDGPFDLIVHCATDYGRMPGSDMEFPNILLPKLLLAEAPRWKADTFITLDTLLNPNMSEYTRTKSIFREYLQAQTHLRAIGLFSDYVYGPGGHSHSFMVWAVRQFLTNAPSIPLTPGMQMRDFIYVDDLVSAFSQVIAHLHHLPKGYSRFDAVTGSPASIRDLLALLRVLTGNQQTVLEFGALPYREHEQMQVNACNEALRAIGWISNYRLEDGLKTVIAYERQNQCAA